MDNKDFINDSTPDENQNLQSDRQAHIAAEAEQDKKSEPLIVENSTIFTAPAEENAKKPKKGKYAKLIAVMLAAALVLTGSIFATLYFLPEKEDKSTGETKTIDLTKSAAAGLESVTIKNASGEYTVVPYTATEDGEEVVHLKLKGYDNITQNTDMVTSIGDYVFDVTATKKLDAQWTEQSCGLDKPEILVTVKLKDGKSFTIKIGNKTPDGTGYYCTTSLKEGIYIVSDDQYTRFSYELTSYIDTDIIDIMEADSDKDVYFSSGQLVRYDTITFSGSRFENPVKLEYQTDSKEFLTNMITSPVKTYADDEKVTSLLSPFVNGMTAADAYVFNPTSADLKKYGLDNPETVITYVIKGKTYTVRLSKTGIADEGYRACTVNDDAVIYKVTADLCDFFSWTLNDMRSNILFARELKILKSVTFEYDGVKTKYDVSVKTEKDEADNEINTYVITQNAKSVVAENFQNLYSMITLVRPVDYLPIGAKQPTGTPRVKITYDYIDGSKSTVVTMTKYNERYYCYTVNGIGDQLINYRTVDNLIQGFEDMKAGKTIASQT